MITSLVACHTGIKAMLVIAAAAKQQPAIARFRCTRGSVAILPRGAARRIAVMYVTMAATARVLGGTVAVLNESRRRATRHDSAQRQQDLVLQELVDFTTTTCVSENDPDEKIRDNIAIPLP